MGGFEALLSGKALESKKAMINPSDRSPIAADKESLAADSRQRQRCFALWASFTEFQRIPTDHPKPSACGSGCTRTS
jgi:hypothetical protein